MDVLRRLGRASLLRCPNCGGRGIRRGLDLVDACPTCGHRFERHEGYWLGAVMINTGAVLAAFVVVFVGGMVVTWPDVPWTGILVVTVAVTILFPILFHPWSKTFWVAMELSANPPGDDEQASVPGWRRG
ncbi:MAG: DUF983 domain-containing protein [Acidimicrobiia bacterium]|nr:DUF983 domain-containing protein [Acidimicrobiia bacterium]